MARIAAKKTAPKKTASKEAMDIAGAIPPEAQKQMLELIESGHTAYADALVHLSVGPFSSKMALGMQSALSGNTTSVINIVMPTNALLDLANNIYRLFSNKATRDQLGQHYETFKAQLPELNVVPRA